MATIRVEHTHDYTVMANYHLRDKSLSLKAKGLLSYMLSLPDDWNYTIEGLSKSCKDGPGAIRAAILELENAGYMRRGQGRAENGTFGAADYTVSEKPMTEKPMTEKPMTEKPMTEKPMTEKPMTEKRTLLNTNIPSTYRLSTDLPKEEEKKESGAAAKLRDEGLARVMSLYLERIEPMPSRTSLELLKAYVGQLGPDVCVRAIERAIDAGARKWTYISAILKNCEKDGIRSLADWDAREEERKKRKEGGVNNAGTEESAASKYSKYNLDCIVL